MGVPYGKNGKLEKIHFKYDNGKKEFYITEINLIEEISEKEKTRQIKLTMKKKSSWSWSAFNRYIDIKQEDGERFLDFLIQNCPDMGKELTVDPTLEKESNDRRKTEETLNRMLKKKKKNQMLIKTTQDECKKDSDKKMKEEQRKMEEEQRKMELKMAKEQENNNKNMMEEAQKREQMKKEIDLMKKKLEAPAVSRILHRQLMDKQILEKGEELEKKFV